MKFVHRIINILLHAWPQKLGAIVLATLIWLFVNVNDTSITQRSLFVPITVEGLASDSVATGLPDYVEVTVAGPSGQVDRLRPDNFESILDLAGESGAFEVPIRVLSPQGVDLRRVSPGDVIGTVEEVTEKRVPVEAAIIGASPVDTTVRAAVEPAEVTVRARASTLSQVVRALAPVRPSAGTRTVVPYPVGANGNPIQNVSIEPESVQIVVEEEPVLIARSLPIELETPAVSGFTVTARMEQAELTVVGPESALAPLDRVTGTVSLPTEGLEAGGYTLPVTLELPEGVLSLEEPTATVRLSRPPTRE